MARGSRDNQASQAKGLLYGPRPQGEGPTEIEEQAPVEVEASDLPSVPASVMDARDRLPLDDLRSRGINQVTVYYNGYGDSGDVDHVKVEPQTKELKDDEEQLLADFVFSLLAANHGGWEINEGSNGTVTLDLNNGSVEHDHYTNYVAQDQDIREMSL